MGKFIVIDGLDGSGKETQSLLLEKKLTELGKKVRIISFPMYENDSSLPVRMYLDGKLGSHPSDTGAYPASMFFACDRYISYVTDWKKDISDPDTLVIANRYTSANAVHQLSKMERNEWDYFLKWLWDFEFSKLNLPVPDAIVYLEVAPDVSLSLIEKRSRETSRTTDIHEKDKEYMKRCYDAALFSCDKLGWIKITCSNGGSLRTREDISNELYEKIKNLL